MKVINRCAKIVVPKFDKSMGMIEGGSESECLDLGNDGRDWTYRSLDNSMRMRLGVGVSAQI